MNWKKKTLYTLKTNSRARQSKMPSENGNLINCWYFSNLNCYCWDSVNIFAEYAANQINLPNFGNKYYWTIRQSLILPESANAFDEISAYACYFAEVQQCSCHLESRSRPASWSHFCSKSIMLSVKSDCPRRITENTKENNISTTVSNVSTLEHDLEALNSGDNQCELFYC